MIAVAGTVARDPLLARFAGIASAPEKQAAGNFITHTHTHKCFQRFMGLSFKGTGRKEINSEKAKMASDQNSPNLGKYKGCTPPPSIVSEQGNGSRFPKLPSKKQLKWRRTV